jgi:hypothetical protein
VYVAGLDSPVVLTGQALLMLLHQRGKIPDELPGPKILVEDELGEFPLFHREAALATMREVTSQRYQHFLLGRTHDKEMHPHLLCAGAPGTGKSRLCQDFAALAIAEELRQHSVVVVNVTFNGDSKFDAIDRLRGGDWALAARILMSYFGCFRDSVPDGINVQTALDCVLADHRSRRKLVDDALVVLAMAIDDIGQCLDDEATGENAVDIAQQRRRFVTSISRVCGKLLMLPRADKYCFVATVFAATVAVELKEVFADTGHPHKEVPIPLLRFSDCLSIVGSLQLPSQWAEAPELLQLLADCGGVPRLVREILTSVRQRHNDTPSDGAWHVIRGHVVGVIRARYRLAGRRGLDEIVRSSLTREIVSREETPLNEKGVETYAELERRGAVFLQPAEEEGRFTVGLPYLVLEEVVGMTRYAKTVFADLFTFPSLSKFEWQTLEKFHATYDASCTMMFSEVCASVPAARFYRGAVVGDNLDFELALSSPVDVVFCQHQFPTLTDGGNTQIPRAAGRRVENWDDGGHVYVNANGAAFDVFSIHPSVGNDPAVVRASALRFSERSESGAVTAVEVRKEFVKTTQALQTKMSRPSPHRLLFGFFTNRQLDTGLAALPGCVMVGREQHVAFYGHAFGPRIPLFHLTKGRSFHSFARFSVRLLC